MYTDLYTKTPDFALFRAFFVSFSVVFARSGRVHQKCIPNHVTRGQGCAVIIIATIRNNGFRNNDVAKVRILFEYPGEPANEIH